MDLGWVGRAWLWEKSRKEPVVWEGLREGEVFGDGPDNVLTKLGWV